MKRLLALLLFPLGCLAQSGSPFTNALFPAQTFTGTAQTAAVIQLNGQQLSYGAGTISLTGTSLTTATFAVQGSSDNGVTFYALPITAVTPGASPAATATATASGLYQVSLVGITHVRFVTSGTFTGTSISLTLTATPNATVSRNGASSLTLISSQTLASTASSVSFTLPAGYKVFKLFIRAPNTGNAAVAYYINFNGDVTAGNYFASVIQQAYAGTPSSSTGGFSNPGIILPTNFSETNIYPSTGAGATYTSLGNNSQGSLALNITAGQWISANTPTSMVITLNTGTFSSGGTFSLYGIN